MVDFDYVAQHVRGVWRMARNHDQWQSDIDASEDGVFKSFWAMALTAPLALLSYLLSRREAALSNDVEAAIFEIPVAVGFVAGIISFYGLWVLSLLILTEAAKHFDAHRHAASLIITYNWSQFAGLAAFLPAAIIFTATQDTALFSLFKLPVLVFSFYLVWGVIRRNLDVDIPTASAILIGMTIIKIALSSILTGGIVAFYELIS